MVRNEISFDLLTDGEMPDGDCGRGGKSQRNSRLTVINTSGTLEKQIIGIGSWLKGGGELSLSSNSPGTTFFRQPVEILSGHRQQWNLPYYPMENTVSQNMIT